MTATFAFAVSSAMFNDRGRFPTKETSATRPQRVAALYAQNAVKIERIVALQASGYIEDACQVAWERLLSHDEVDLDARGVLQWLVITATREAWRHSARPEVSLEEPRDRDDRDHDVHNADQRFEPVATEPDPLTVAIERDEARRRLARLSERERHYLALQALGFTYEEISLQVGASRRTVERQLLRAQRKLRPRDED